ncbi:PAS domain-containing sensor histidine kinase [bacterium AH-315-P13]|nr:PAS domain-containing sensor histidine kinase [bacterium AH-315-P13]
MEISSKSIWNDNQEEQLIKSLNKSSMVSITDPKGIIIYVNDTFCKKSGYDEQELLGQNHRILKSGKQPDALFKDLWTTISSKRIWRGEICNKRKDGSFYWHKITIVPFTDNDGNIEKYVAIRFDITKNKENIERLKIAENKFSSIFDAANDAIFIVDKKTKKIINVNNKATYLLGYTTAEFIGMHIENLYSEKNLALRYKQMEQLTIVNDTIFETKNKHKNGSLIDVEISSKLFNDGAQEAYISIVRDITLRKLTDDKLKESELNKNLIIEHTPYCIHRIDKKGVVKSMNTTGLKMLGLKKEDVIGTNFIDFFKGKEKLRIKKLLNAALKGKSSEFEFTPSQEQVWASTFIPIINDNKDINILGITQDITDQRIKEKKIKHSEEKFKLIFDSAPDAYFISDMDGVVKNCNTAAEKLSGYTKKEMINGHISDTGLLSKADRTYFINSIKVPSKKAQKFEFTVNTKQDEKINIELISHHTVIDDENVVLTIAHDITERKTTLNELRKKTKDLELLLYRSGHDLRAPFTSLEGLFDLLKHEIKEESALELIEMVEKVLNDGKRLIDNLSTSSVMLNNSSKKEQIDFNELVNQTLINLNHIDGFKNISININIPKEFKFISNHQLLSSILQNLLQNAIKYQRPFNTEHTPFIIINAFRYKDGIKISIKDNGNGIKKSELDKVFDLYYRSNTTVGGTGLGLYITKNAIEQLGGKISVTSILKKETQIDIQLPNIYKE